METTLKVLDFIIIIVFLSNFVGKIRAILSQQKEKARKASAVEISIAVAGIAINLLTLLCGFYKAMAIMLIGLWLMVIIIDMIIKK